MNSAPPKSQKSKCLPTLLALVLLGSAAAGYAQSTVVNLSAGPGLRDVRLNGGNPVPDGNQIRVGYFTSGFDVAANAGNLQGLAQHWNSLGTVTIQTIFGQPGRFGATLTSFDSAFSGQKICLWILQTTDNGAPLSDYQNLLGYGIFSSSAAQWLVPQWGIAPPNNTASITSSEVNQAYFGSFDSSHLYLTQVPEPSAWGLLLTGFLAFKAKKFFGQRVNAASKRS